MKKTNLFLVGLLIMLLVFTCYSIMMSIVMNLDGFSSKFQIENIYILLSFFLLTIDYLLFKIIQKREAD